MFERNSFFAWSFFDGMTKPTTHTSSFTRLIKKNNTRKKKALTKP